MFDNVSPLPTRASNGVAMHNSPAVVGGKLVAPPALRHEIMRNALCKRIIQAQTEKLVVLRAPAGFGKTTVMRQVKTYLEQDRCKTVWLNLDQADNDLPCFLSMLTTALGKDGCSPSASTLVSWNSPASDSFYVAKAILQGHATTQSRVHIFLDDYERIHSPAVSEFMNEFIDALPSGWQIIIGCRGVPHVNLGALRSRGQLLEVDPSDLRLSLDDVQHLVRIRCQVPLPPRLIHTLYQSTEGWPAAVWLACLSLEGKSDPGKFLGGFSGSSKAVMEYLIEDVLSRQSPQVSRFLLQTSILDELNSEVCDAVCQSHDSKAMLDYLEQASLFIQRMPNQEGSFRYHTMFADCLQEQLKRENPSLIVTLHRRAAQWSIRAQRPISAIAHALAGQDHCLALPLLAEHAPALLEQGRVRLLARWMTPLLRHGVLDDRHDLRMMHAWAVCFSQGPQQAWPLLLSLEETPSTDRVVVQHRLALRPLLLAMMDKLDEADPLGTKVLESLDFNLGFAREVLEITLANLAIYSGRYVHAIRLIDSVRSRPAQQDWGFSFVLSETAEAAIDLVHGRLRSALVRLRLAVNAGADLARRPTNGNTMAAALYAQALYESGCWEHAERILSVQVPMIRRVGVPDQIIAAHVMLSRIHWNKQDIDAALSVLAELEHLGYTQELPRAVVSARLERVRIYAHQGKFFAARTELLRCNGPGVWGLDSGSSMRINDIESLEIARARCAIAAADPDPKIMSTLRAQIDAAERSYRHRRMLSLRLLYAMALWQQSERNKAMRALAKAVQFAAAEGYVSIFLDEGPRLRGLLLDLFQAPGALLDSTTENALEQPKLFLQRLLAVCGVEIDAVPVLQAPVEPACATTGILTKKELKVLELVAQGLSNGDLASRLFVAETTIRTHLRSINCKLLVKNRTEAVQAARRLGLLI